MHAPARQWSPSVHKLLSVQIMAAPPLQTFAAQTSPEVQASPSSQAAEFPVCRQAVPPAQASSVHALPSSQPPAEPAQTPLVQTSLIVQIFPSLQALPLPALWSQPLAGLQLSLVHGSASLQSSAVVPTQPPAAQWSPTVQTLLSLQLALLTACVQPLAAPQASSVHALPSSQGGGPWPAQTPALQASPTVHGLPSLHALLSATVEVQPLAGAQLSVVHGLPSSQFFASPPEQLPFLQTSATVQPLPSSQAPIAFLC